MVFRFNILEYLKTYFMFMEQIMNCLFLFVYTYIHRCRYMCMYTIKLKTFIFLPLRL